MSWISKEQLEVMVERAARANDDLPENIGRGPVRRPEVNVMHSKNPTEKRLTRGEDAHEQLIDSIRVWLDKHHGPKDADYLRSFLNGSCEHPYHRKTDDDVGPEARYMCDLCGG